MNVQFAVKGEDVYVLEVNPRASRTVPFVSKAIGVPLAKLAAKVMAGKTLRELGFTKEIVPTHYFGEGSGLPVPALSGHGYLVRPGNEIDRRSDGNRCRSRSGLRQIADGRAAAVAEGRQRFHQRERRRQAKRSFRVAREFVELGFGIIATSGTAAHSASGRRSRCTKVFKLREGRPNVLDRVKNGDINFIINTPSGKIPREDEVTIRNAALAQENSDHDDGARGAGERERNSLAAKESGAR